MQVTELNLKRILVIVDADQLDGPELMPSALLSRAISVAKETQAEIELFHVCHDATLEQRLFFPSEAVQAERASTADHYATRLAELALEAANAGVSVSQEVRWDSPEADAVLRRVDEYRPDLVMLAGGNHDYVWGVMSHLEWELLRRVPVPVWLVSDEVSDIKSIVTAIGTIANDEDVISAVDYGVARVAGTLARVFGAENYPVHAFSVPPSIPNAAAYRPIVGTAEVPPPEVMDEKAAATRKIAEEHGKQIAAFLDLFDLDPERVHVAQGNPAEVVTETANARDADVIVMGARNLTRWERMAKRVTAEPVLGAAKSDVIFAKAERDADVPAADEQPVPGEPLVDLEAAITKPEEVFASPNAVAKETAISADLRLRILDAWEQDVRATLVMQEEGAGMDAPDAGLLEQISLAKAQARPDQQDSRANT